MYLSHVHWYLVIWHVCPSCMQSHWTNAFKHSFQDHVCTSRFHHCWECLFDSALFANVSQNTCEKQEVFVWNRCGISGIFMVLSRPSWGLHSGRRTTVRWVGGRPVQLEFGWDGAGICKMQKASKVLELFYIDLTWSSWWIDRHTDVFPFKFQFMSLFEKRFFFLKVANVSGWELEVSHKVTF